MHGAAQWCCEKSAGQQPTPAGTRQPARRAASATRPPRPADPLHRVHQRQVREGLGVVAEVATRAGLDLLGVQAQRPGQGQQLLQQLAGAHDLADVGERGRQPERADQERALLAGQPVVGLVDAVAQHEAVLGELVGDREHGRDHARVVGREEPDEDGEQGRGVQARRTVALHEHTPFVDAVRKDIFLDVDGRLVPPLRGRQVAAQPCQVGPPVAATQHITFEEVKCCGSPRTSQIPRSGSCQCDSADSTSWSTMTHARCGMLSAKRVCRWMKSTAVPHTSFCRCL